MKFVSRHIVGLGRVSLLIMVLGSSGLTAVVRICTMEAMSCCAGPMNDAPGGCDRTAGTNSVAFVQPLTPCIISSMIGGFTTNPAVVEKQHRSDVAPHMNVLPVGENLVLQQCDNSFLSSRPNPSQGASPPAVEKYVLTSTFLI